MRRVWILMSLGILFTAPALVGWFGNEQETRIWAFGAEDSQLQWSAALPSNEVILYSHNGPLSAHGKLFIWSVRRDLPEQSAALSAWDAASGQRLWTYILPADQSPHTYWDAASGQRFWTHLLPAAQDYIAPQITTQRIYLVNESREGPVLVALDQTSGKELWSIPQAVAIATAGEDLLILTGTDGNFSLSRKTADGSQIWSQQINLSEREVRHYPVLSSAQDMVYLLHEAADQPQSTIAGARQIYQLRGFKLKTGTEDLQASYQGSPPILITSGMNTSAEGYEVLALGDEEAQELWRFRQPDKHYPERPAYLHNTASNSETIYLIYEETKSELNYMSWVIGINRSNGQVRLRVPIMGVAAISPYAIKLSDTTVVFNERNSIINFSQRDGTVLWEFTPTRKAVFAYTASANTIFIIDTAPRWHNWLTQLQG